MPSLEAPSHEGVGTPLKRVSSDNRGVSRPPLRAEEYMYTETFQFVGSIMRTLTVVNCSRPVPAHTSLTSPQPMACATRAEGTASATNSQRIHNSPLRTERLPQTKELGLRRYCTVIVLVKPAGNGCHHAIVEQ